MVVRRSQAPDILIVDAHNDPLLIGEVKAVSHFDDQLREEYRTFLRETYGWAPYLLLADRKQIDIYRRDGAECHLPTAKIISRYAPGADPDQIFQPYLERLLETWLNDVAFNWHSSHPPAEEDLTRIGLTAELKKPEHDPIF